jgi:RNase P subunit RPR2
LCIILGNQFAFAQEKELFKKSTERTPQQKEENIKADYTEKKKFNEDTYNELKKEVELVEEIAKKKNEIRLIRIWKRLWC